MLNASFLILRMGGHRDGWRNAAPTENKALSTPNSSLLTPHFSFHSMILSPRTSQAFSANSARGWSERESE